MKVYGETLETRCKSSRSIRKQEIDRFDRDSHVSRSVDGIYILSLRGIIPGTYSRRTEYSSMFDMLMCFCSFIYFSYFFWSFICRRSVIASSSRLNQMSPSKRRFSPGPFQGFTLASDRSCLLCGERGSVQGLFHYAFGRRRVWTSVYLKETFKALCGMCSASVSLMDLCSASDYSS